MNISLTSVVIAIRHSKREDWTRFLCVLGTNRHITIHSTRTRLIIVNFAISVLHSPLTTKQTSMMLCASSSSSPASSISSAFSITRPLNATREGYLLLALLALLIQSLLLVLVMTIVMSNEMNSEKHQVMRGLFIK